jgi:hypothetical protein
MLGPGAGRTSIGGGSGATCWLTMGALSPGCGAGSGTAGGRGAVIFALEDGCSGRPAFGATAGGCPAAGGGIEAGKAGGRSPRSIASSLLVSRSIALTASHDDSDVTSTVRWSASGEPTANS